MDTKISDYEIISNKFTEKYKDRKINWGFNGLGYIVYKRTYARIKQDGDLEEWPETIQRCVNGAQKIGAQYTKEEAEKLFDYIFNLKCNFAGRMLWQLGTPTVERFGGNSLLNCWFTKMNSMDSFEFLFENLMLGGGIGYSVRREDVHELPKIKTNVNITHLNTKDADLIIADSRSGWVRLLHYVLKSFFETGNSFTYSTILVRGAGEPIKGFGGTASGPKILIDGITKICNVIKAREGKKLRSLDVLDICNIIGSIVVAGNVRRSAQIALGDPDDYLFLRAKRWDLGILPAWRSMSNNTIYADDYSHILKDVWEGYDGSGEPYGLFNLPLCQKYGRLGDEIEDNCSGVNPCQPAWAKVLSKEGWTNFEDLKIGDSIWSKEGWTKILRKWSNGIKKVYEYQTEHGPVFNGTKNHKIFQNGKKIEVDDAEYIDCFAEGKKDSNWRSSDRKTRDTFQSKIISRVFIREEEVFDITVDNKSHSYWTQGCDVSNCGEIPLADFECCNLSELYLNNIQSKEELIECSKLLYKTQKAISSLNFIHKRTNEIVHKNMRLGLGVTGICQSLNKLEWLDECYKQLRKFDKEWSKIRDWPTSIKLTTCKPSGTISLLGGSTPGIHPAFSKYYIRRVRMSSEDKLVTLCKDAGFHVEYALNMDETINRDTVIVEFPCQSDTNAVLAKDMSAVRQLELVKEIQTKWADNSVSVTVYYKLEELPEIKEWLKNNYKSSIKSVSFLLHKDHNFKQPPYQEINEETYNKLIKKLGPIKSFKDTITGTLEGIECEGGVCPIK